MSIFLSEGWINTRRFRRCEVTSHSSRMTYLILLRCDWEFLV